MTYDDEPVNFEEVRGLKHLDEQIDQRLRGRELPSSEQETLDPELLRELQAVYQPRAQRFQNGLARVWGRLGQPGAVPRAHRQQQIIGPLARPDFQYERQHTMSRLFRSGQHLAGRVSALVAVALLVVLVGGLAIGLILVHRPGSSPTGSHGGEPTATKPDTSNSSPTTVPFSVSSVDLTVSPNSIAGLTCGTSVSFTYTATFHIPAGTAGGTILFSYTLNNGRSSTPASVSVGQGETSKAYSFTSSGTLPLDHTYPGVAEVQVNSPNTVNSPQVQPSGTCVAGAFKVTSVDMAVSPSSIAGKACGTPLTVTYTATFHIAPKGPGGTIHFEYTINNGRGTNLASINVAAGQTIATYSFTWSGNLPPDHTYPENGGVIVDSPNSLNSPQVAPSGKCS